MKKKKKKPKNEKKAIVKISAIKKEKSKEAK